LIAEAVVNAEARRNQAEDLLSDEQAAAVKGGKIPTWENPWKIIIGYLIELSS
jgi:hypothetical protein